MDYGFLLPHIGVRTFKLLSRYGRSNSAKAFQINIK